MFQTLRQPDSEHSAPSQQTQRGFHGEERTAARGLHPAVQQRPGQGPFSPTARCVRVLVFPFIVKCLCVPQVKDLLWNSDSSVLAVWLEDMTAGEDKQVNTYSKLVGAMFDMLDHISGRNSLNPTSTF